MEAEKFYDKVVTLIPASQAKDVDALYDARTARRSTSRNRGRSNMFSGFIGNRWSREGRESRGRSPKRRSKGRTRSRSKSKSKRIPSARRKLLFSVEDLSPEWKKILRAAGLRKKDFLNPKLQGLIKEILVEHNISIQPPPAEMRAQEARKYYNSEELQEYELYQQQMKKYEEDYAKFLIEMENYKMETQRLEGLERWEKDVSVS